MKPAQKPDERRSCACKSDDAYRCWAVRYERPFDSPGTIEDEGGPCECACHDSGTDDEGAA